MAKDDFSPATARWEPVDFQDLDRESPRPLEVGYGEDGLIGFRLPDDPAAGLQVFLPVDWATVKRELGYLELHSEVWPEVELFAALEYRADRKREFDPAKADWALWHAWDGSGGTLELARDERGGLLALRKAGDAHGEVRLFNFGEWEAYKTHLRLGFLDTDVLPPEDWEQRHPFAETFEDQIRLLRNGGLRETRFDQMVKAARKLLDKAAPEHTPTSVFDTASTRWHRTVHEDGTPASLEIGYADNGLVALRIAEDIEGDVFVFTSEEWRAFLRGIR